MIDILKSIEISDKETSVALGCFDGLHLGHKSVILKTIDYALLNNLCPTIFTFSGIPETKNINKESLMILTKEDKIKLLEAWGIKRIYIIDFKNVMNFSPEDFVKDILKNRLKAKRVFCGFNYRFGKGGIGDTSDLIRLCNLNKIGVNIVEPVKVDGKTVSSTIIRENIKSGNLANVRKMLGRYFSFEFTVVEGKKLGKKIGIPTLNQLFPKDFIIPKFGVYSSITYINGKKYRSVTNIGVNPTTGDGFPKSETWVMDYKGKDFYGENIRVELVDYIREEKKFNSLGELKQAILSDARTKL